MALIPTETSIFRPAAAATDVIKDLGIAKIKAVAPIQQGADVEFSTAGVKYDQPLLDDAMSKLGIATEMVQERLARLALEPTKYKEYLDAKQGLLTTIRKDTITIYIRTVEQYMAAGIPKLEAEAIAKKIASQYRASQMELFSTFFPKSGEKVKAVY